jgi:hypothetical protein
MRLFYETFFFFLLGNVPLIFGVVRGKLHKTSLIIYH